jgi:hypothetical protein
MHLLGLGKAYSLSLQSIQNDGQRCIKSGERAGPSVYRGKNLKASLAESSTPGVLDFSKLKTICRFEKDGMCKAILPKL